MDKDVVSDLQKESPKLVESNEYKENVVNVTDNFVNYVLGIYNAVLNPMGYEVTFKCIKGELGYYLLVNSKTNEIIKGRDLYSGSSKYKPRSFLDNPFGGYEFNVEDTGFKLRINNYLYNPFKNSTWHKMYIDYADGKSQQLNFEIVHEYDKFTIELFVIAAKSAKYDGNDYRDLSKLSLSKNHLSAVVMDHPRKPSCHVYYNSDSDNYIYYIVPKDAEYKYKVRINNGIFEIITDSDIEIVTSEEARAKAAELFESQDTKNQIIYTLRYGEGLIPGYINSISSLIKYIDENDLNFSNNCIIALLQLQNILDNLEKNGKEGSIVKLLNSSDNKAGL